MCGRYALGVRLTTIRQRLQNHGMQVDETPEDSSIRETYNFAPGNIGAIYRADVPDNGYSETATTRSTSTGQTSEPEAEFNPPEADEAQDTDNNNGQNQTQNSADVGADADRKQRYKLQSMKWGLVPFWTKRQPDYGSLMRTINCRDDSLVEDRGMWTTMKRRKRCVVVCQGFYEWLKKGPGGREKVPHFVKRRDGELMCFAGLWDCAKYEGSEEKLYTYTIITTASNNQLKFLHDRMPVILDLGSDEMKTWLDPTRTTWSKELQSILKPYEGELECYAVPKEVGKVGNNSPDFIVPIDSKKNKSNIANFFANAKEKNARTAQNKVGCEESKASDESQGKNQGTREIKVVHEKDEQRTTQNDDWSEDNAPVPLEGGQVKREHPPEDRSEVPEDDSKRRKLQSTTAAGASPEGGQATLETFAGASLGKASRGSIQEDNSLEKEAENN